MWTIILTIIMGILMAVKPNIFRRYSMSDIIEGTKPSAGMLKFNRAVGIGLILFGFLCLLMAYTA